METEELNRQRALELIEFWMEEIDEENNKNPEDEKSNLEE